MELIDCVYVGAIAILYSMFFSRTASYVYDINLEHCKYPRSTFGSANDKEQKEYDDCRLIKEEDEKTASEGKFRMLILVGVVSLVSSGMLASGLIGQGMSVGAALIILRAVFSEWHKMGEKNKLIILALGLAIAMYGAHTYRAQYS